MAGPRCRISSRSGRRELVNDLGGDDNVSTQQSALIDLAIKSKLLIDRVDPWLVVQPSLVSEQKKEALLPVVLQRQQLADGFALYLSQLGLERRRKVKILTAILNEDNDDSAESNGKAT